MDAVSIAAEPLVLGDLAALDRETPILWGRIALKTADQTVPSAEVFMAKDRSRFRVIDGSGKTEYLSSLQFCRFVLELRATGRFSFERSGTKRRSASPPPPPPASSNADTPVRRRQPARRRER